MPLTTADGNDPADDDSSRDRSGIYESFIPRIRVGAIRSSRGCGFSRT